MRFLLAVVLVLWLPWGSGCRQRLLPEEEAKEGFGPRQIQADALLQAFAENPAAADHRYRNVQIIIFADVIEVGRPGGEGPEIVVGPSVGDGRIRCQIKTSEADKLSAVRPGVRVSVLGICRGKDGDIKLTNCTLMRIRDRRQTE